MKRLQKLIASTLIMASTILILNPIGVSAEWRQNSDNSWSNTEVSINYTGWYNDNGTWYYFKNGTMQIGWIIDNGKWYYLSNNGSMLSNTTINGYVLNASGEWIPNILPNTNNTGNNATNTNNTNNSSNVNKASGKVTIYYDKDYNIVLVAPGENTRITIGEESYKYLVVQASDYGMTSNDLIKKALKLFKVINDNGVPKLVKK